MIGRFIIGCASISIAAIACHGCAVETGSATVWTAVQALASIAVVIVAVFQDRIRSWVWAPRLELEFGNRPPDAHAIPIVFEREDHFRPNRSSTHVIDAFYFRVRVRNSGRAPAQQVEVFARALRRSSDGRWEPVLEFVPMNLTWSHIGGLYFPFIVPGMDKHCDLARIVDPAGRDQTSYDKNPWLKLKNDQCSLAFTVIAESNNRSYIVGPGDYQLDVEVAAANATRVRRTMRIRVHGVWFRDEERMLRDGVKMTMIETHGAARVARQGAS